MVLPERCYQHPRAWTNLLRRFVMDSLSSNTPQNNPQKSHNSAERKHQRYWEVISKQCITCGKEYQDARGRSNRCFTCRTNEQRAKVAEANRRRKVSDKQKAKIAESNRRRKVSDETKEKHRQAQLA